MKQLFGSSNKTRQVEEVGKWGGRDGGGRECKISPKWKKSYLFIKTLNYLIVVVVFKYYILISLIEKQLRPAGMLKIHDGSMSRSSDLFGMSWTSTNYTVLLSTAR